MLSHGMDVESSKSLVGTFVLKAPRWVLLDISNTAVEVNEDLKTYGAFNLGTKAHEYFSGHPESISLELDIGDDKVPLARRRCEKEKLCNGGWAKCKHDILTLMLHQTVPNMDHGRTPMSLDDWVSVSMPEPRACLTSVALEDQLFVIGGATGEKDLFGTYTKCSR
mmetsp:Transcript_28643/g.59866  ORF Transcript_28643/g.59866 Transcript_28643/m.59866 type:complete len:166 (-) Transcript_28643:281-778(-)